MQENSYGGLPEHVLNNLLSSPIYTKVILQSKTFTKLINNCKYCLISVETVSGETILYEKPVKMLYEPAIFKNPKRFEKLAQQFVASVEPITKNNFDKIKQLVSANNDFSVYVPVNADKINCKQMQQLEFKHFYVLVGKDWVDIYNNLGCLPLAEVSSTNGQIVTECKNFYPARQILELLSNS